MIRRPPRSTPKPSSAASDVYKRQALARAIAAPVDVDRQAVYPVKSFGAGMTPMYTALALWVGALLTAVSVRTDVVDKDTYSPMQRFFGRFGMFAAVGLVQSTMLILGLIFFVGIEPAHPILMLLAGWVSSLIFMLICYTFVVSFANAGKALAVLMLVIQVSSSGGAYPCLLYTSPSPRDQRGSRMPSSA